MTPSSTESSPPPAKTATGTIFQRYALLVLSDVACRGLRFAADIVLVRHFSQAVIGQLNLSQSLAVQGMALSTCGLDTAGTRAVAAGSAAPIAMAATVTLLRLVLGLFAWGAVVGLTLLVPTYHELFELTALYGLSIVTGALTVGWVPLGQQRMHIVAVAALATQAGYFAGVELTARAGWPPLAVPLLLAFSEGITALGLWCWLFLTGGPAPRDLPRISALRFLRDSLPIGGASFLRTLTLGSDVLLLGLFVGAADVGLYSTGFKLYSLGVSLITMYQSVLLPQFSVQAAREPETLDAALGTSLRRAAAPAIAVTLVGILLARFALTLLFGAPFAAATGAVQILFVALPAHLAAIHFRTALVSAGLQRLDFRLVAFATAAHVMAKLCLIPWLGNTGAACGTLCGEIILVALGWQFWRRVRL